MSFCRITGRARNLPKSHFFPINTTYTAADLRRFCHVTGKSVGLPAHHFEPIVLKKKVKKKKSEFKLGGGRDVNYGIKKHKVVSSQRYAELDLDSAAELKQFLDEVLDGIQIDPEEKDKRYVYQIGKHKNNVIVDARIEAAIRSGAIEDILFAKDGETVVLKTRTGRFIPLDLKQVKGRAIGVLFEGEGVDDEEETPEIELGRVTAHLRRASLFERITDSVLNAFPDMKTGLSENGKLLQKELKNIINNEKYSNLLVNFVDNCVEKIILGAAKHGNPVKGIGKRAHRDEKIVKILKLIFDNQNPETLELQRLAIAQEEGENVLDRINGTAARYTPGTLDYIIANINTCDPNETIMNILQLGIQTFLKEVSSHKIQELDADGNVIVNGCSDGRRNSIEYYEEFLKHTTGLINCLTRSCGEIECYGADVQTILTDFIHTNAVRCNFETPKVELIMEIYIQARLPLFYTHDEDVLQQYLSKRKKKCRGAILVIKEGIKAIIPKSMLKFFGDKSATMVALDNDGIEFVLGAIKAKDHFFLDGNHEGFVNTKQYISKRPRRRSSVDKKLVRNERRRSSVSKLKKQRRRAVAGPTGTHWKNVYKKYNVVNGAICMFRAYTHDSVSPSSRSSRY